jgi:hypothetical protein
MKYIVLTINHKGRELWELWRALPGARKAFNLASARVPEELSAAFLYVLPGEDDNIRAAIEAVKSGQAVILDRNP